MEQGQGPRSALAGASRNSKWLWLEATTELGFDACNNENFHS